MTSTTGGDAGASYGWINRDNLDIKVYMSLYPWDKGGRTLKIKN